MSSSCATSIRPSASRTERRGGLRPPHAPPRRAVVIAAAAAAGTLVLLYVGLPAVAGLDETWRRLDDGDGTWLAAAAVFELVSFGGYVLLFRAVLGEGQFGWRMSTLITLAGVAATRLFAAGGAGGIALTAWVLRRAGRPRAAVATSLTAFLVLLYAVFMVALVVAGAGLGAGLFAGPSPTGLTWVPAALGAGVIAGALALLLVPRAGDGVRLALGFVRRRDRRVAGAAVWWAFDLATLWACLHAFGDPPALAPLVMAYFVGMLGNLLPVPGGVGGVDGAMIGALVAFGVATGLAIVAVLTYRGFALWLPTLAGIPAYTALTREMRRWSPDGPPPAAR